MVLGGTPRVEPPAGAWAFIEAALRREAAPIRPRPTWGLPVVGAGGVVAAAALVFGLLAPIHRPWRSLRSLSPPLEPDMLRALTPTTAAGLVLERSTDPLVEVQNRLDRLLDRVADEGS
jgi:hypothetical protein